MRVHRVFVRDGEVRSACFKDMPHEGAGMSTDWSKYATPEQTRQRGAKVASNYVVIEMNVGDVRAIPDQRVAHDPLDDNRAHSLVHGPKGEGHPRIRLEYLRIARIVILLEPPEDDQ
jgi:hypothetical protein